MLPAILRLALLLALLSPLAIRAELVLVTGVRSGAVEITRERAEKLFLGRSVTLGDGTPVSLIDLPNGVTRDEFYLKLTGKNPSQIRAYWSHLVFTGRALPPREAESVAEARQWLAETPNLIGYMERSDVSPGLRILLRLP